MFNKWKIIHGDINARNEHKICAYCKRFYCTDYYYPRNRMCCSGILPKWEFLYRLMCEVRATDACKKFEMHKIYKQKMKNYQNEKQKG